MTIAVSKIHKNLVLKKNILNCGYLQKYDDTKLWGFSVQTVYLHLDSLCLLYYESTKHLLGMFTFIELLTWDPGQPGLIVLFALAQQIRAKTNLHRST